MYACKTCLYLREGGWGCYDAIVGAVKDYRRVGSDGSNGDGGHMQGLGRLVGG